MKEQPFAVFPENEHSTKEALSTAQHRLRLLKKAEQDLLEKLNAQRTGKRPDPEILNSQLQQAQQELGKIEKAIQKAKAQSKKRKREIDEWKLWYNALGQVDKTLELKQLNSEIAWRADEIAQLERRIMELSQQSLAAESKVEACRVEISALKEGALDLPVAQDPRLMGVRKAIQEVENMIFSFRN